jgi:hypothetical protein
MIRSLLILAHVLPARAAVDVTLPDSAPLKFAVEEIERCEGRETSCAGSGHPRDDGGSAKLSPTNGHWPHQINVREARRLVGNYVMTENDLRKKRTTPHSIGMGSYAMDSHNVMRYITDGGYVQNEGDVGIGPKCPYAIAYGALISKPGHADNLLVPAAPSFTHIAFGSVRMEPVSMILGQSAATAAVLTLEAKSIVENLPYATLQALLLADGQILEFKPTR